MPFIVGTTVADSIAGTAEDDTLLGGAGNDTLSGGAGRDIFRFEAGDDHDVILDFDVDEDRLDISGIRSNFIDTLRGLREVDGNLVIATDEDSSVTLQGLSLSDFRVEALFPDNGTSTFMDISLGEASPVTDERSREIQISALSNGGFAVTWRQLIDEDSNSSRTHIYSRIFDADGEPLGDPFRVNVQIGNNYNFTSEPLAGGGYVVAWYNLPTRQGYFSIYGNDGELINERQPIGEDVTSNRFGITPLNDGGFVISYGGIDLFGKRYDALGQETRGEFTIHDGAFGGAVSPFGFGGVQLSNGTIVFVRDNFPDGANIHNNRLGEIGILLFGERLNSISNRILVNEETRGNQSEADIVELAGGGFVVVWRTSGRGTSDSFTSFRVFDATGAPVSDEIVTEDPVGPEASVELAVRVTATGDGGFAVIWRSADRSVYLQQYDEVGNPLTDRTLVEATEAPYNDGVDIATLSDGTGVAVWQTDDLTPQVRLLDFAANVAPGAGDDDRTGTADADFFAGEAGDDSFSGLAGADLFLGGDGTDTLDGGGGPDTLHGGSGNDLIIGGTGQDVLLGGQGADTLDGGSGEDTAVYLQSASAVTVNLSNGAATRGNAANDTILNVEHLTGSNFSDRLIGDEAGNQLRGEDGDDTLIGGDGSDQAFGGAGKDVFFAGAGDAGNDLYIGGTGADLIAGGAGNDLLVGGTAGGNDFVDEDIAQTAGVDTAYGGDGNDTLLGGNWQDSDGDGRFDSGEAVVASLDRNFLFGGAGQDLVIGSAGDDEIGGGLGNDTLMTHDGRDILWGGADSGADYLVAGEGDDTLFASLGNDTLEGGSGNDIIFGGGGNDTLLGGQGDDDLYGGGGNDQLSGGDGADTFFFGASHGDDTITDFAVAEDVLFLVNTVTDFTDLESVLAASSETEIGGVSGVLIDTGGEASIFLQGVELAGLTLGNLVLSS